MKYRSNHILALIPPCDEGAAILRQALFFRQSLGMQVFIYHIIDKPSLFERLFHSKRAKNLRADVLRKLEDFTRTVVPSDELKHFTYRIKYGKRLPILLRQSRKGGYEFIIINKSGTSCSIEPYELDKLISMTACPVMVINKDYPVEKIDKIIIPVDVLQSTPKKLLWATYFAKKYQAKIIIVSALTLNIEKKRSLAWRNAEKLKHMLLQRGVECEVAILKTAGKDKHVVILNYIKKEKPGMVIIRTHQETASSNTQIGSFVSKLVHKTNVPVFAVNQLQTQMPVDFEIN